jgi:hypothetical protein
MSSPKLHSIDIARITTVANLLQQLHSLDDQLQHSTFSRLIAFNTAYSIVSKEIYASLKNGYFENPKFIEKFTVCFSQYYFQVINDVLAEKSDVATAWSNIFRPSQANPLPNFIYLLMGANAHINHDLSLAMQRMLNKGDTSKLFKDILQVDKLLMRSSKDIVDAFTESKTVPRIIQTRFKFLYRKPVMYMILYWRFRAWRDYKRIVKQGVSKSRSKVKGKNMSVGLIYLGRLLIAG